MTTLSELVPTLLVKTKTLKLNWEELGTNSYIVRLDNFTIQVALDTQGPRIAVVDEFGRTIEAARPGSSTSTQWDQQLAELYQIAKRNALKVDVLLNDLKNKLDRL